MEYREIYERDVDGARERILYYIQHYREKKVIYFSGWRGFGAAAVLRSIEQVLVSNKAKETPPGLCFDRIIYVDCSVWESKRVMQRQIAEELGVHRETMAMFDKQDEEDDFNGVDHGSRDVIRRISAIIDQTVAHKKILMIFLNGGNDEVDMSTLGIHPDYCDHIVLWTFTRHSFTIHDSLDVVGTKLRYTHLFLVASVGVTQRLSSSEFSEILLEESARIVARHRFMRGIDRTTVKDCCLYELFLQCSFHQATEFNWAAHAANYWMCDGIIKGDGAIKTSNILHQEICWESHNSILNSMFEKVMEDLEAPFLVLKDDGIKKERPYRWISLTAKKVKALEDMLPTILARASSLFVALEKSNDLQGLPNGFLKSCSNIGVLILSYCAFSFVSPPFLQCYGMRFLGLDHCTHDNTSKGVHNTNWRCLQNLWVLDLRYTEWDDILSEEKMDIMPNLRELNIEGFLCWELMSTLQGRLSYLQILRIVKPTRKARTSIDCSNSFVDKTKLEILDLSGNKDMENLPASLSLARSLRMIILDACDGLKSVVPDRLPSSLSSFSYDGYGLATRWASSFRIPLESELKQSSVTDNSDAKTTKISLQGCTELENLFVRGLTNLLELDVSGSAIKVLDLETMLVNVPGLKRLFLLGCERLRAINWGPFAASEIQLELICIDTRPKQSYGFTRPSLAQHKSSRLQLYAVLADARLTRSLHDLLDGYQDVYFNIHVTSSTGHGGGVQNEATGTEIVEHGNRHHPVLISGGKSSENMNATMLPFPEPPTQQLDRHIEISDKSCSLESELATSSSLGGLMRNCAESLHVHDVSTSATMPGWLWFRLKWCRMERCPNLNTVFPPDATDCQDQLEIIWVSDLLTARSIWSKGYREDHTSFANLQHLQLNSCPRLQFVLPVWVRSFPRLKTIHIKDCSDLKHVFVLDQRYQAEISVHGVLFPKLTTINLYGLPKLQQIMCDAKMVAPALETIWIRGCFAFHRLPNVEAREPGVKRPTVEMEKDVWDALEWEGLDTGHHPDLFEPLMSSKTYYRTRFMLRGSVLR